ncbi:type II toxin-antitoxin system RelE family toxin [Canibacter oris]|uniref:mRNA interferase RelE/StbE n=1 Tax=Canibacter oris TaxID=1365628 RepID=A0A840DMZ8_9MICO|nr:type II toxin-antitoxin system RelE/ParE family toxin [Canibacter oris]MBB4071427.1 mRNA interferase RelE/StbE [Canibacter oris]
MSVFRVKFSKKALKQLAKLDKFNAHLLITWIRKNLEGATDPYAIGKSLVGSRSGEWRYRVGDYRIICFIENQTVTIHVLEVGHRRENYDR